MVAVEMFGRFLDAQWPPIAAGGVSGIAVVLVGQPFDTIKVRQQMLQQSPLPAMQQCLRSEGLAGLYKGTSPQLIGSSLQHAIRMGSYGVAKDALVERDVKPAALVGATAGLFTGCCVSVIATPVERLKCMQQVMRMDTAASAGTIVCARQLYDAYSS